MKVNTPGNLVSHGSRRTGVGNMQDGQALPCLEQLTGQMRRRPDTRRGVTQLVRLGQCQLHQILYRLDGAALIHHEDGGCIGHGGYAFQILDGIKWRFGAQRHVDGEAAGGKQQRVPVSGRLGDSVSANAATGAQLVLHHNRLP